MKRVKTRVHSLTKFVALVALAVVCIGGGASAALAAMLPSGSVSGLAVNALEVSQTGTINVESNVAGATFNITGQDSYSGTAPWSTDNAPAGFYSISWGDMPGYTTPGVGFGNLTDGGSITFTGNYTQQAGTINVNSTPAGATFSIHGPTNYNNQTTPWSTSGAPAGDYTISWDDMPGYTTPPDETQTLEDGDSITFTGNYASQTGTIYVNSTPAGASFSLTGAAIYIGKTPWTRSDAPVGSYTISWGELWGYTKPSNQTQTLTEGGNITFTGNYVDIGAPVIDGVRYTDLTGTSVTIVWTTSENATSQVEYGLTTGYGSTTILDSTLVLSHSVALTGLTTKTTYYYRVKSVDASGNPSQSGDYVFVTADIGAPVISDVTAINVTGTSATITWKTDDPAESQVEYGETASYNLPPVYNSAQVTNHSIELTGLTPQVTYHYKVKSRDASGLWSESGDFTFITIDVTAPTISGLVATDISATTANIIWTTNEAATSLVEYGTTASYGSTTNEDTARERSHSVRLTGLKPRTTYHYRVKSKDASGLWAESGDATFTTTDINAPVISNVAPTNITGTDATITWTTDDPAESQVEYGTSAGYGLTTTLDANRVTKHSVNLTGLSTQTTYHYKVKSRDASGLWAESADYTFTTGADSGGIPPLISLVRAFDMTGSGATIAWETNREATSQVEYGLTTDYGKTTTLDVSLNIYHSVDLKGLEANKTYHYRVISRDAFGNQAQSEDYTFDTTIGEAPSLNLPNWAWAIIGVTVALAVGAMVIREV
jgi:phosphodiesterase/alkaline phosphatase D-like protein